MVNLLVAPGRRTPSACPASSARSSTRPAAPAACSPRPRTTSRELNPDATVEVFGQELNPESWAICRSDLMIKGQDPENIAFGNSFTDDGHAAQTFDYLLANPPFGVEWKKVKDEVEDEHETLGDAGRFGAGLPRINDGSLLFLQHMISQDEAGRRGEGGSRIAIVFNGSPLFTGAAGSGESEIRRWILENDWLEAIVALPDQLFYNTGISTYFWILTNRKDADHKGKVVLLDARDHWAKMRKSLGDKRKDVPTSDQIADDHRGCTREALTVADGPGAPAARQGEGLRQRGLRLPAHHRRAPAEAALRGDRGDAGGAGGGQADREVRGAGRAARRAARRSVGADGVVRRRTLRSGSRSSEALAVARQAAAASRRRCGTRSSVRDPEGEVQTDVKGDPSRTRTCATTRTCRCGEDVEEYLKREVLPHVPDAWIDHSKTKIGYEIPFTRHFYVYKPPRPLAEIDAELKALEAEIQALLGEVTE